MTSQTQIEQLNKTWGYELITRHPEANVVTMVYGYDSKDAARDDAIQECNRVANVTGLILYYRLFSR